MRKNLLLTAIITIIAILATSCKPNNEVVFPQDIVGFWQSQPISQQIWYGLEVTDNQSAIFHTYQEMEEIDAVTMSVTYDAATGKGQLSGDGIFLQMAAASEKVINIKMVDGDRPFTPGKKPAKVYSITGLWKSAAIDDMRVDMLIFPQKNGKINLAYMVVDEVFGDMLAVMGGIHSLNENTGKGSLTASYHEGEFTIDTIANPLTMNYIEEGIERTFVQQPKKDVLVQNMQGIWHTSVPGTATATIEVDENNQCVINYNITTPKTKKGKTKGIVHFCSPAGMGAVEPAGEVTNEDFIELFGEEACGIFSVKSSTEVTMNIMGIEVVFTKQ